MSERTNHDYDLAVEVGQDIARRNREAKAQAQNVVPFGQERVTPAEFWAQASANPKLLQQMLKKGERDAIVKAIREGKLRKG